MNAVKKRERGDMRVTGMLVEIRESFSEEVAFRPRHQDETASHAQIWRESIQAERVASAKALQRE